MVKASARILGKNVHRLRTRIAILIEKEKLSQNRSFTLRSMCSSLFTTIYDDQKLPEELRRPECIRDDYMLKSVANHLYSTLLKLVEDSEG